MKLVIVIETDNAAFEDNPFEVADILLRLEGEASRSELTPQKIIDSNGNKCGYVELNN